MENVGERRSFITFEWRWLLLAYCYLVLFHFFPSYFLFGLRRLPTSGTVGPFSLWIGIGAALVSGFVAYRSKAFTLFEPVIATFLYLLTILILYGSRAKMYLPHSTGLKLALAAFLLLFCLAGIVTGRLLQMRKERKSPPAQGT
jgi:hypothetical protein